MIRALELDGREGYSQPEEPEALIEALLGALGEDPSREGLVDTPRRVWDALRFLTAGYAESVEDAVGNAMFAEPYEDMVLVKDIRLFSLCEHHLLPFTGHVDIAYVPDGAIVGLSKLPRLVNVFARRLQVQERLTRQIAEGLDELLHPRGVAVRIDAEHLCMSMRGVEQTESRTVTEVVTGVFQQDQSLYGRFCRQLAGV